jgi:signal transduction histidine kinase
MGTLVAGVAHELNNPLSNISTSNQILDEELADSGDELARKMVRQIDEQTNKARDIVRTLLEFSREKEFHREHIPLLELIRKTIILLHSEVKFDLKIHVDVADEITIFADQQKFQQILLNLIKNSLDVLDTSGNIWIKANRTGGKFLPAEKIGSAEKLANSNVPPDQLSMVTKKANGSEISVTDDGPGIAEDILPRIFDPFFTTKDVGKGSGLGLFVVHDLVELHGGNISVTSGIGTGTKFVVWLPSEENRV